MDGLHVDFNKEKGILAFLDPAGRVRFVYSLPAIKMPSGKKITPSFDWDVNNLDLHVNIPDIDFPLALAFGVSGKLAGGFGLGSLRGLHFGGGSEAQAKVDAPKGKDPKLEVSGQAAKPSAGFKVYFVNAVLILGTNALRSSRRST